MAVDLKKFKKRVEKKLPIIFLVEETTNRDFKNYSAQLVCNVMRACLSRNIQFETMVISYGFDWNIRYPSLKGNDDSPRFQAGEHVKIDDVCSIVANLGGSIQTFLGSALDLSKAILDDPETVLPDRYKPAVVVVSPRMPAKGWEKSLEALLNDGRSSQAQVFWVSEDKSANGFESLSKYFSVALMAGIAVNADVASEKSANASSKVHEKVTYIKGYGVIDTGEISKKIVDSFVLEPLDEAPVEEPPAVEPVEFDAAGFEGSFGDGASAKGDGTV